MTNLIERIDDGELLKKNKNGTYSFINSLMDEPFEYDYDSLMESPEYKGYFRDLEIGKIQEEKLL